MIGVAHAAAEQGAMLLSVSLQGANHLIDPDWQLMPKLLD
jgi:hypothetical protein